MTADNDLRMTFNQQATLYHAMRPRYPQELFDTIVNITKLKDHAELLEIGAGTGLATESFAKRGYKITAVELGDELTKVAEKNLEKFPKVHFINAPFELANLPHETFDLVYVATALHWIQPDYQFRKPHQLLKSNGHFAIITTKHVSDEAGDAFYFASDPLYEKYDPGNKYDKNARLIRLDEVPPYEIDETLFTLVYFKAFSLIARYTAKEYVQLIDTYSVTLSMEPDLKANFLREMKDLIDEQFDGSVVKCYAMGLTIAKKK